MLKRGQILSQPFVYIFAIIVIAFILLFGIRSVIDIIKIGNLVETKTLINKIEKQIDSCYNLDKGSTCSFEDVVISRNIKEICFVNSEENVNFNIVDDETTMIMINNSINYGEGYNFFLIPKIGKELDERRYKINNLYADENPLCERVDDGMINLVMINDGVNIRLRRI